MTRISIDGCWDSKSNTQVDCDEKEKDQRSEQYGRDNDKEPRENHVNVSVVNKPKLQQSAPQPQKTALNHQKTAKPDLTRPNRFHDMGEVGIALAKLVGGDGYMMRPVSPQLNVGALELAIIGDLNQGKLHTVLGNVNRRLIETNRGGSRLNIQSVAIQQRTIEFIVGKNEPKPEWRELIEAVNTVMDAYEKVYGKIDAKLAADYQRLMNNFRYSPNRVAEAQKRYMQLMNGKRFQLFKKDWEILDKLAEIEKTAQWQQSLKKLNNIAQVFGGFGKALDIYDLVMAFKEAQRTKNWDDFSAKVSSLGAGMLIGHLTKLALAASFVTNLPVALLIAILSVIASNYFVDDALWKHLSSEMISYFEK